MTTRFTFIETVSKRPTESFAEVVTEGLSQYQKTLPCRFFYDAVGSDLFEQICQLPEYYLTRAERSLLTQVAPEIIEATGDNIAIVEFGSGSSCKTRLLLTAALARQKHLHYTPIDISGDFLHTSSLILQEEYPRLAVTAIAGEYNDSIEAVPAHNGPRLFLFLGSNIGNFEREEAIAFLRRIRKQMQREDRLLVGVDLIKERETLEAAYNDAQGVTAAFNKNLLRRINQELDADFDREDFVHTAPFVESRSRIEMRLLCRRSHAVRLNAVAQEFTFEAGEYIHTENSHKYTPESFAALCGSACLEVQEAWTETRHGFATLLLKPV